MSQLAKKFILANAVDGTKILMLNTDAFRALNSTATPVNLFNFSAANKIQFTQTLDINSQTITGLPTAVNPTDAINFSQAQALVSGLSWKTLVNSATTGALPAYTAAAGVLTATSNGALPAQDGVTLTAGQRLLVNNETGGSAPNNGIYVVTQVGSGGTPFILTRSSDANTAALLQSAAVEVGVGATTQAGYVYFENLAIATINTSNVGFISISSGISYTFSNGLLVTGSVVTVKPDPAGATAVSASGVAVVVDTTTVQIKTDQIHAAVNFTDVLTLNGTDITNQYKDLTYPVQGVTSLNLCVVGSPIQLQGTDYSVSATGGSGGVGRVTFLNGLATGGASALVSTDVLIISYNHF